MHPYSTNLSEREVAPFFVATCSFGAALLLGKAFALLGWMPPVWMDVPGAFGLYGLGTWLLRRRLWKLRSFQRGQLIRTPVLEGTWAGHLESSFDGHVGRRGVTMTIRQDWNRMLLTLRSSESHSKSQSASLLVDGDVTLAYEYQNEPRAGAVGTMHTHRGMARLTLSEDRSELSGDYFTGRGRQNTGTLTLRRI